MSDPFDPLNAPIGEPATLMQKAFVHWRQPNAVSDDYAIRRYEYHFRRIGDKTNTERIVAVDATGYVVLPAPDWPIGEYTWSLHIRRVADDARFLAASGRLRVLPDATTAGDHRSHAEIMVDKIQSLIEGRADTDVVSYTIAGRMIAKMPLTELIKWRDYYRAEVEREKHAEAIVNGRGGKSNVLTVRFI